MTYGLFLSYIITGFNGSVSLPFKHLLKTQQLFLWVTKRRDSKPNKTRNKTHVDYVINIKLIYTFR